MNIEDAIAEFELEHHRKYSSKDRKKILEVVEELGITEFKLTKDHIAGVDGQIGIHSTMIVAGLPFAGSVDRGPTPYRARPHHFELDEWDGAIAGPYEKSGVAYVTCPVTTYQVPANSLCECGEFHSAN